MKTPSLERCKKLKEIGYPQKPWYIMEDRIGGWMRRKVMIDLHQPTVAEMIYIITKDFISLDWLRIMKGCDWFYLEKYDIDFSNGEIEYCVTETTVWKLPNALADMIILLHEKGFKLFDK